MNKTRKNIHRRLILLSKCTQLGLRIQICFLHLLLCPVIHPTPYQYVWTSSLPVKLQCAGIRRSIAISTYQCKHTEFTVSFCVINIRPLWKQSWQLSAAKHPISEAYLKSWQKRRKPNNIFQILLHLLSENVLHRKCSTFLSLYML